MDARDRAVMADVLALIRYYSRRGWNWLDAAEYTLSCASGRWPVPLYGAGRTKYGNCVGRPRQAKGTR